jgi:two-component system, chemotaxis family, response regulator PixG
MNDIDTFNQEHDRPRFFADRLPDILSELSFAEENNCLKVEYNSVTFFIHFNEGQLVYATNSLAPFERLERHLRRLSNQNSQISNSIIKLPRQNFTNDLRAYTNFPTDYQSIIWLLSQGYLNSPEAIAMIRRITREVFESFLCLPSSCRYRLIARSNQIDELCRFNLTAYIEQCEKRLEGWQAFTEQIFSSYQRPYLVTEKEQKIDGLSKEQNQTICKLLKGLNFRQISAVIDLDELVVARILYPSLENNTIIVRDAKAPFDQLPNLRPKENIFELASDSDWRGEDSGFQVNSHSKQTVYALEKTWKVAYVDNDTVAQANLTDCLKKNLFSLLFIQDAMDAFAQLIEFKPSLILLSSIMPELSGYELCSLLKNHHDFRQVPIIMVSETPELIDEVKSKRAGATACISKPFDSPRLLDTVWQYLD